MHGSSVGVGVLVGAAVGVSVGSGVLIGATAGEGVGAGGGIDVGEGGSVARFCPQAPSTNPVRIMRNNQLRIARMGKRYRLKD